MDYSWANEENLSRCVWKELYNLHAIHSGEGKATHKKMVANSNCVYSVKERNQYTRPILLPNRIWLFLFPSTMTCFKTRRLEQATVYGGNGVICPRPKKELVFGLGVGNKWWQRCVQLVFSTYVRQRYCLPIVWPVLLLSRIASQSGISDIRA